MIDLEFFNNDEKVTMVFEKTHETLFLESEELDLVLSNNEARCSFFCLYVEKLISAFRNKEMDEKGVNGYNIDYSPIKEKHFSQDFILEIMKGCDHSFHSIVKETLTSLFMDVDFFLSIRNSPWQIHSHDCNQESYQASYDIVKALTNLPEITLNDERFSAFPLYTSQYNPFGLDRSVYLKNQKGSPYKFFDKETGEKKMIESKSGYNSFFMDGKVGVAFYFKNKPSMLVTFDYDTNKNIFIKQVQCQNKDRGHYKIKGDWKIALIDYVKSLFPDYNIHLISGEDIAKLVSKSYQSDNVFKPEKETLKRIEKFYNDIYPNSSNWITVNNDKYKSIKEIG